MYGKNYSLGSASRDNTDELSQFNRGRVIYVCKVIDDVDPNGAGLIKVRIVGLDDKKLDAKIINHKINPPSRTERRQVFAIYTRLTGKNSYLALVALSTAIETPGPIVELRAIFFI